LRSTVHVEAGVVEACVVVDDVVVFVVAFSFLLHRWGDVGDVDFAWWNMYALAFCANRLVRSRAGGFFAS
jgi:hypothetical protein